MSKTHKAKSCPDPASKRLALNTVQSVGGWQSTKTSHRALELDKLGLRERVRKTREAAKASFAIGEFEIVTERAADGAVVATSASQPRPRTDRRSTLSPREGRIPPRCRSCNGYIKPDATICPHCGADIHAAAVDYDAKRRQRAALIAEIEQGLARLGERAQSGKVRITWSGAVIAVIPAGSPSVLSNPSRRCP